MDIVPNFFKNQLKPIWAVSDISDGDYRTRPSGKTIIKPLIDFSTRGFLIQHKRALQPKLQDSL